MPLKQLHHPFKDFDDEANAVLNEKVRGDD